MTRYEFLKASGFTGAALFATLSGCVSEQDKFIEAPSLDANGNIIMDNPVSTTSPSTTTPSTSTPPSTTPLSTNADVSKFVKAADLAKIAKPLLTIDLNAITSARLKIKGGYIVSNNAYVVALSKDGFYIAATILCTHEPKKQVIYSNEEWFCTAHDARFTLAGKGINKNGSKGLTIYNVATDGSKLIVY
jgi:nitrite reductase/ring-hydroxylating ferredoxin subunit